MTSTQREKKEKKERRAKKIARYRHGTPCVTTTNVYAMLFCTPNKMKKKKQLEHSLPHTCHATKPALRARAELGDGAPSLLVRQTDLAKVLVNVENELKGVAAAIVGRSCVQPVCQCPYGIADTSMDLF